MSSLQDSLKIKRNGTKAPTLAPGDKYSAGLENGATSTGEGGIAASLKKKAAGTVNSPGIEKDVNAS